MFDVIAFDCDDTLWQNESLYRATQAEFRQLLARYHDEAWVDQRLYETEIRNIAHYGYGIKAFMLSMVETAVELTEGRVEGPEIIRILELGRGMLAAPVTLLVGVPEVLEEVSRRYELMLITKGDLLDQETKIERSGLQGYFRRIEIVSRKDPATYTRILARHGVAAERFLMVGDSLRSDVLPVVEIGGRAVHIPQASPWQHEVVPAEEAIGREWVELESIARLPEWLRGLEDRPASEGGPESDAGAAWTS